MIVACLWSRGSGHLMVFITNFILTNEDLYILKHYVSEEIQNLIHCYKSGVYNESALKRVGV